MFATPSYTKTVPLLLQPQWIYTCAAVRVNPTRAPWISALSRSLALLFPRRKGSSRIDRRCAYHPGGADRFWRNRVLREKTGRQKTRSQKIGRLKPYGNRPPDGVTEADRSAFLHQTYHHHRETAKGNPHPNKVWMGIPFFSKKKTAANATVF